MRKRTLRVLIVVLFLSTVVRADNWPQWRGPNLNGVSNEKNLPVKWTTEENVVWKLAMPGWSGSTPIIWRDRIFLNVADGGDVTTSHLLWSTVNGPDVPTPVTDGKYFYVVNDRGIVWCLDARTGAEIYSQQRIKPGTYSGSPVLADGKIYITNEDGLTTVIAAGAKFEVLVENPLNDYCLSSPAISDGQIFIRTAQNLYCIGKK